MFVIQTRKINQRLQSFENRLIWFNQQMKASIKFKKKLKKYWQSIFCQMQMTGENRGPRILISSRRQEDIISEVRAYFSSQANTNTCHSVSNHWPNHYLQRPLWKFVWGKEESTSKIKQTEQKVPYVWMEYNFAT